MRPIKSAITRHNALIKDTWGRAESLGQVDKVEETQLFHLTQKEADKCRYVMTNMDLRMAECTVHTDAFTHGVRMHPPHLWDLRDGIIYYRENIKAPWVKWSPLIQNNTKRFKS